MNQKQRNHLAARIKGLESRAHKAVREKAQVFTPYITNGDIWDWIREGAIRENPATRGNKFNNYEFFDFGRYSSQGCIAYEEVKERFRNNGSDSKTDPKAREALEQAWTKKCNTVLDFAMLLDGEEGIVGLILQLEKEVEDLEQQAKDRVKAIAEEKEAFNKAHR